MGSEASAIGGRKPIEPSRTGMNAVSDREAEVLARTIFGIEGSARRLGGERDQNFRIDARDGQSFALKLSHPGEPVAAAEFQTAALRHVERRDLRVSVPRVVPTLSGEALAEVACEGGARQVRMLGWLSGEMLCQHLATPELLAKLGEAAAWLDLALVDFAFLPVEQELLWDFAHIQHLWQLSSHLEGDMIAPLVETAFAAFLADTAPATARLRRQYLHNDLNPHNVLVGPGGEVTGILDFGDMVHGLLIGELAIACSYHLGVGDTPLQGAATCVAAYHAALPLTPLEMALLPSFIAARLAMTVLITEWRARLDPVNRSYILRNNPAAREGLALLAALAPGEAQALLAGSIA